jgi:hypothetical protein
MPKFILCSSIHVRQLPGESAARIVPWAGLDNSKSHQLEQAAIAAAALWPLLRLAGVDTLIDGFGRLMQEFLGCA